MVKDCPYCEGKNNYTFLVANMDMRVACEYCVKGHIPKRGDKPGLFERIKTYFNGDTENGD